MIIVLTVIVSVVVVTMVIVLFVTLTFKISCSFQQDERQDVEEKKVKPHVKKPLYLSYFNRVKIQDHTTN